MDKISLVLLIPFLWDNLSFVSLTMLKECNAKSVESFKGTLWSFLLKEIRVYLY